jgi:2-haloacid dehalogenase
MTIADQLRQTIRVCMFDQYGTVVDMQSGLSEVATPYLKSKGWEGNPYSFVTWWRRTHFENSMIDALLHNHGGGVCPGRRDREAAPVP